MTYKSFDGSVITLEDGSRWLVSLITRYEDSTWLLTDDITVLWPSDDPTYDYQLIDTNDGSSVDAMFLGYG